MTTENLSNNPPVQLRDVQDTDLIILFQHQLDPEANQMAAFTSKDPTDKNAFMAHWAKIMADDGITIKTILYNAEIAGYILTHDWFGNPEISYWIGKSFWGRGVATSALHQFLDLLTTRPLFARVAKDNLGSFRVLQKCGFLVVDEDKGFANARGAEIEEFILKID